MSTIVRTLDPAVEAHSHCESPARAASEPQRSRTPSYALNRLFICDPVCAQPFGHNAAALAYFSNALADHFTTRIPICCKHLPKSLAERHGFEASYDFYYHDYMPLSGVTRTQAVIPAPYNSYADDIEGLATQDADRLIDKYGINATDSMLFPSVDFYGAIGVFNALIRRPVSVRPRLFLRFIGVMESASLSYRDPLAELVERIRDAIAQGLQVSFGAETPRLADVLADMLDCDVTTVPYPDFGDQIPLPEGGPFWVFCPGSARFDKGYLSLHGIFAAVRRHDPDLTIRFVAQTLRPREGMHHADYTSRLYAIPGVELLDSSITDNEMRQQYARSCLVLLPYDIDIYRNRGSAAMMEAACYGRPIATLSGSAFAEQITWYRLGRAVHQVDDLANAILEFARVRRHVLQGRSSRARRRLMADGVAAYDAWLGAAQ